MNKMIMQARMFKALSDENRLKILDMLKDRPFSASELLSEMEFGQSTLSHHMKILLDSGVVQGTKYGKRIIYTLQTDFFEKMICWMKEYL